MRLFGKSKKNANCCAFEIKEVKEDKKKKSSCCNFQLKEVDDNEKSNKSNSSCCE